MKPLQRKFHRTCHFHLTAVPALAVLAAGIWSLNTKPAMAQEPATAILPPAGDAGSQTGNTQDAGGSTVATEDLQERLNTLEQRLEKVAATDLDPISLVLPNISSNVPNAYGAAQGMAAVGFGFQERTRYSDSNTDGTVAALVGLGDPRKFGADIQVSFLDLSRFGQRIGLGFKLHRQFPNDYAVAFGGENVLLSSRSDSDASYYGVVTKKLRLAESSSEPFSRVYLSAGLGTGRFRSESDVFNDRGHVNVFGSAAVNLNRSSTAFAEWTGQSLNVGTSITPFRKYPFVVTLALADIAGSGGDGARFTAGIGYVFSR